MDKHCLLIRFRMLAGLVPGTCTLWLKLVRKLSLS